MQEHTFSPGEPPKQGENPVRSGFDDYEVLGRFVEECSHAWENPDRNDLTLLRALSRLTWMHPAEAAAGFTPIQIADEVRESTGKNWEGGGTKEEIGKRVRLAWRQLERTWERKKEGVGQRARDRGFGWVPAPIKKEGGGAGNPSRYFLSAVALALPVDKEAAEAPHDVSPAPGTSVRYICEDVEDAGGIAAALARGYPLSGWRLFLFSLFILGALLGSALIWFVLARLPMRGALFLQATGLAVFAYAAWHSCQPILTLGDYRIVRAPWWLQSIAGSDDRLLELRWPADCQRPSIKAVRYRGECSVCSGKVTIHAGGFEFPGRLVGRCGRSPREHVFSFDHVLRWGKPLR